MATAREKKKNKDRISKFQSRIRKIRCHQCSILRGTQGRLTIMFHNGVPG